MKTTVTILYVLLLICTILRAQVYPSRNFNIYNGLPSNYLYNSIVDKHGYLWITSTQGIIKYNGYNFRVFNSSDGLPKEDIWQLFEDRTGRIWLGTVTEELGYIDNDRYHSVKFDGNHNAVYPSGFNYYGQGIALFTSYANNSWTPSLYIATGKGIKEIKISDSVIFKVAPYDPRHQIDILLQGRPVWAAFAGLDNDTTGYFILNNIYFSFLLRNDSAIVTSTTPTKSPDFSAIYHIYKRYSFSKYVVFFSPGKQNFFLSLNKHTGDISKIDLSAFHINEDIQYIHHNTHEPLMYVFTKTHALTFDATDTIRLLTDQLFKSFFEDNRVTGEEVVSILKDKLWGNVYTTKNYGAFIFPQNANQFNKPKLNLQGYVYINSLTDGTALWWNEASQMLAEIRSPDNCIYTRVRTASIRDVIQLSTDTLLLCGYPNHFFKRSSRQSFEIERNDLRAIQRAFSLGGGNILTVSNYGFLYYSYPRKFRTLSTNKFSGIARNKLRNEYWAYNATSIVIYNPLTDAISEVLPGQLKSAGIKSIESICIDSVYGNIFIKDIANIWCYDPRRNKAYAVPGLEHTILRNCKLSVNKDQLLIAGKIGAIDIHIKGKDSFDKPKLFTNTAQYSVVYHLHMLQNRLLLSTDKGIFDIPVNDSAQLLETVASLYKFEYLYKDKIYALSGNDTAILDPANLSLQFDIINPNGSGQLKYTTWIGKGPAHLLAANELTLPNLEADTYYLLKIVAHDDIWQSSMHTIVIYVQPRWYQTHRMQRVIAIAIVAAILLLMTMSVIITRRLVLTATKKRNARMELELKSIYAQINPHFIFNSLNSALLLVSKNKTEEAYTHISKFSRLLRSYIKSSRNKHVLLAEELKNLTNYIDLQQVRFKDRFEYNIYVASPIDTNTIYIPSLLLQPFVENAIEHGLLNKEGTGHMIISFSKDGENLICTIDDDGIGRKESKANKIPNPVKEESYGELLIKDLVSIFNKYEHMNIAIDYTDKTYPETGTTVTIKIKLNGTAQI